MQKLSYFAILFGLLFATYAAAQPRSEFSTDVRQYAAKAVCTWGDELSESGIFGIQATSVNLHNPYYEDVNFRWKLAAALPGREGEISRFVDMELGPDGATRIDCNLIKEWGDQHGVLENGGFEGFVIIQSESELDVTAFHYAGGKESPQSVEVETYRVREINAPGQIFQCHNGNIPLQTSTGWTSLNGSVRSATPNGNQHNQTYPWLTIGGTGTLLSRYPNGNYFFLLDFCLCEDGEATVEVDSLRADNFAQAFLDGASLTAGVTNNFGSGPVGSGSLSAAPTTGQHQLIVFARNFASSTGGSTRFGISIAGALEFENGYLGQCR